MGPHCLGLVLYNDPMARWAKRTHRVLAELTGNPLHPNSIEPGPLGGVESCKISEIGGLPLSGKFYFNNFSSPKNMGKLPNHPF